MGNRSNRVKVINRVGAKVGERVVIAISEGGLLRGAARLYLIPLLALFVTVLSAEWILDSWFSTSSELLTIGLGAVGAFASVRWMKSRGLFESEELIPTIVKLYNDPIISPIV
jgi:positive regulator of sigma E activity